MCTYNDIITNYFKIQNANIEIKNLQYDIKLNFISSKIIVIFCKSKVNKIVWIVSNNDSFFVEQKRLQVGVEFSNSVLKTG